MRVRERRRRAVLQWVRGHPRRAGTAGGGTTRRQRALRRPRRLHGSRREARPRGRARSPLAVLRAGPTGNRAFRRFGREVHRRRGHGHLRRSHRPRRRSGTRRAGRSCRAGGARRDERGRPGARPRRQAGGQHGRGDRGARGQAESRGGDGGRRRGQYRCATSDGCAGQRNRRRRGDLCLHEGSDRVRANRSDRGKREGVAHGGMGRTCTPGTRRRARLLGSHGGADQGTGCPAGDLGSRGRGAEAAARHALRSRGNREVTARPGAGRARHRRRRDGPSRSLDGVRWKQPVRRFRPAGEAVRAHLRQRPAARGQGRSCGRGWPSWWLSTARTTPPHISGS